jgi:PTH2 family peptidyl-tRNA hydrolase
MRKIIFYFLLFKKFKYTSSKLIIMELKQVIIIRNDLRMSKGKIAAQASHASVDCLLKSHKDLVEEWRSQGMKKIILKADNLEEIMQYKKQAEDAKLAVCVIKDAGQTEVKPGTITCIGIGPDDEKKIDKITGHLSML